MITDTHPILRPARLYATSIEPGYLRIDADAAQKLAEQLAQYAPKHWLSEALSTSDLVCLRSLSSDDLVVFLTIFHTIGFCYWPAPRWTYTTDGTTYDGAAALLRALCKLYMVSDRDAALQHASSSVQRFKAALAGTNELPLLDKRQKYLKQLLDLLSKPDTLERLTKVEDALTKVFYIKDNLPGFADVAVPQGFKNSEPIPFLKRAQLLTNDIDFVLQKHGPGLDSMDKLTAFADYKVPQIMRHSGILVFGNELKTLVDQKIELPPQSRPELAIRTFTLLAVEALRQLLPQFTSAQIDSLLWLKSQTAKQSQSTNKSLTQSNGQIAPYHRTITSYY